MEIRRKTYGAAIRLAVVLSVAAAMITVMLDAVGDVSATGLTISVAIVGFVMSWVQTGRIERAAARPRAHRITVMPLHQPAR